MKNIPRIFVDMNLESGIQIPASRDVAHYLGRVMRTDVCRVFNNGREFDAQISADGKTLHIGAETNHRDPGNALIFCFAPIKRTDDMLNMVTQLGVAAFQPVITERTVAHHINWDRMHKIVVESAEQSNRNSVPLILPPIKFSELDMTGLVFADERAAYGRAIPALDMTPRAVLVGPEGGFSHNEFAALDAGGARGISLGATILRAEVAAVATVVRVMS
ncbi:MAG: 16S rRNA (uracil(1498)-N(3))-methyltransferase [Alphaproteobacteria bacterium]|nr:16S rRNA (uracil(1498)-N(3))-methyltransferase [Alphaproteobacteria bacterium]MDE6571254.1 16S rRNA (uracil(1498)-N(3))-methyltransferase [Alphaproteobacteria bacterium]